LSQRARAATAPQRRSQALGFFLGSEGHSGVPRAGDVDLIRFSVPPETG
jgi:hypothetical protein